VGINLPNFREVTPLEEYEINWTRYETLDEATAVSKADLIAKVTLKSKKEYIQDTKEIPEIPPEIPELYYTVFDFSVDEIYYCRDNDIKKGGSLKAFTTANSYDWTEELIEINENEECIVFFTKVQPMPEDAAKSYEIADYVLTSPVQLVFKKSKHGYEVHKDLILFSKNGVEIDSKELEINPDVMSQKEIMDRKRRKNFVVVKNEIKKIIEKIVEKDNETLCIC
jgi:hypothetical protein